MKTTEPCDLCGKPTVSVYSVCTGPKCRSENMRRRYNSNPTKQLAATEAWRQANKAHVNTVSRDRRRLRTPDSRMADYLRQQFGLSMSDYAQMLAAQSGVCAICENTCSTGQRLSVDHDHGTGKVRGLLCRKCNTAIGFLKDDPMLAERALDYLKEHARG